MVNKDEHRLLSVGVAAIELRLSVTTVRRLLRKYTIPVVQVGGPGHAIRIRRSDLDRLFEAQPK
jgi:excisionase family DNA binding protein